MYDQLIAAFRLDNTPLLAISALTFMFGYPEYVYRFALTFREKRAPYPVCMHTFYVPHDRTWDVLMLKASAALDRNSLLTAPDDALVLWSLLEYYTSYHGLTLEQPDEWAD